MADSNDCFSGERDVGFDSRITQVIHKKDAFPWPNAAEMASYVLCTTPAEEWRQKCQN